MTIEEMKILKKERGYSYAQISERSEVPLGTVQKIFCGVTKSPRYETIKALERAFYETDSIMGKYLPEEKMFYKARREDAAEEGMLHENTAGKYFSVNNEIYLFGKKQGEYTIDDYYALPDERRVELINGVFYDMASPTSIHQIIADEIRGVFANHIKKNKGKCIAATAPLDVRLNMDDRTMIQPDVIVVCDRDKFKNNIVYGAPDLTVEILSNSTRSKDMVLKLNKYLNAGVREYWIIDPKNEWICVYKFTGQPGDMESAEVMTYGRNDKVPVGIFSDECEVDFGEIFDYVQFLKE